ncbi:putative DNA binding domain-containing protein [Candidatus Pseudothioglobus singularis]|nr:putative DNA binding domain-containing protein [Candidatus Pseudothioglobus singularis]
MSISKIQEAYKDVDKVRYEALSNSSRDEYLNDYDNLELVLYNYCVKYLKIPLMSKRIPRLEPIDEEVAENLVKNTLSGSLEILHYYFWDWKSYTTACSKIFDLLAPNGIAAIRIPNLIFEKVKADIEPEFYINGIFGYEDGRDSIEDEDYILPLSCKYIGLWISRIKTEQIFVWTEPLFDFDEDAESDDMMALDLFHQSLSNKIQRTPLDKSYKHLIAGNPIFYPREDLINLEHLYYTLEFESLAKSELSNNNEKSLEVVSEVYGDSPFDCRCLSLCFKKKGEELEFDNSKFTELHVASEKDDWFESELYKEFKPYDTPSLREKLTQVKDFLVIETLQYDFSPISFTINHPSDFRWSEYKKWQFMEGELKVCLLKINTDEVLLDYLLHFLKSKSGDLKLKLASFISLEKEYSWRDIAIPLPEIKDQKTIVSSLIKTSRLNDKIKSLEDTLLSSPINAIQTEIELTDMVNRLEMISDAERILQIVNRRGKETKTVELKETFQLDVKKKTIEKYIETSSLKVICSFLNTEGGTLLIGLSDDGELKGMNHEIAKHHKDKFDVFKLTFAQKLDKRIGKEFLDLIDFEFIAINPNCHVLEVKCIKIEGDNGCYLDGSDFYIRRNPYTEKIEGKDLVDYSRKRFSKL